MTSQSKDNSNVDLDTQHIVRITSGGKIKNYVDFSLKFLEVSSSLYAASGLAIC